MILFKGIDYCGRMYNKSSENILIEHCLFGYGHGVSRTIKGNLDISMKV